MVKMSAAVFVLILTVVAGSIFFFARFFRLPVQPIPVREKNEDELSQTQVPTDVISAVTKSKSTSSPVSGIRADGKEYHLPILMYHYVEHVKDPGDTIRISLNTLPEVLDQQISTLVSAGYTFLTPKDLADILDDITPLPQKAVILTFDDGYSDFYTGAFPILKKYHVRATAYIISGFLNGQNYLTDTQLLEISKSGLVEIGAHTVHHLALKGLPATKAWNEIEQSKIQLEQKLGISITAFAYPYGSFDLQAIQLVKQAGMRTAVSTIKGENVNNSMRFFAHRIRPGRYSGQSLLTLLNSNE